MAHGRIGGILLAAGSAWYLVAIALWLTGSVDTGLIDTSSVSVVAALLLGGFGAGVLALAGPAPLDKTGTRVGLAFLAIGLVSLTAGTVGSALILGSGTDPLSTGVVPLILIGLGLAFIAIVLIGVSLALTPGPARLIGGVVLAALLCLFLLVAGAVAGWSMPVDAESQFPVQRILGVIGFIALMLGGIGIGGLAIVGSRRGSTGPS